ncbi:6093_t:CDS:2, partial [Gigaspora rosea]
MSLEFYGEQASYYLQDKKLNALVKKQAKTTITNKKNINIYKDDETNRDKIKLKSDKGTSIILKEDDDI